MKQRIYDMSSYNLHVIKTDKFKTIKILIGFRRLIKKEELTIRNFLKLILLQSTKKYPTKRLLSIEAEKLYGLELSMVSNRIGKYDLMGIELTMLNEKYTEKGILEKSLNLLFELIFNPNVDNGAFDTKSFNIVKNIYSSQINSVKDDPQYYSIIRMLEEMDKNEPYAYRLGYIDDLEKIDEKNLFEYYESVIKSDAVDIYVLGDVDAEEIKNAFKDHFKVNTIKKNKESVFIEHTKIRSRIKKITEKEDVKQAKLVIGCKLSSLTDFERKYVMSLYNSILGGPSYSRLFQNVREKHSLAYNVWSVYRGSDNMLIIYAGIDYQKFDQAFKLVKKEMNSILKSDVTDDELDNAKKDLISVIKHIEDTPGQVINAYQLMNLVGLDDLETRKKNYLKVTKDDIKRVAKKIKMDTVFLLYGDEIDEENSNSRS
jgi:predicted Zn-dependent peptidase